jgi:hypothetical protein
MPRVLVPEDVPRHADSIRALSLRSLSRAAIATGMRAFDGGSMPSAASNADFLRRRGWDGDRVASTLVRTAVGPATTSTPAWAGELGHVALALIESLKPQSAGAQLLAQALQISLDGLAQVRLPLIRPSPATFVKQGDPIRVSQLPTAPGAVLSPAKLATIVALSREQMESSNAESIVTQSLIDSCATGLDLALFSANAAVADTSPAGLLLGAVAVPPSTQTIPSEAMGDDLAGLAGAISNFVGASNFAIIASPPQAARLMLCGNGLPLVLASSALPSGKVVALAVNALAASIAAPAIDAGKSMTLQFDDATPGAINTAASRSIFQIDAVAIRVVQGVSWAVRDPAAVSVVSNAKW